MYGYSSNKMKAASRMSAWSCSPKPRSWLRSSAARCGRSLCGHQITELPPVVIQHGADHVLIADHPELEMYRTLPYARVIADLIRTRLPYIFLVGATPVGRDLAPRLASAVRCGLTADCTDLQIGDYTSKKEDVTYHDLLYQIRPAFGGNVIATIVNPKTRPQMATVREGVMRRREPDPEPYGRARADKPRLPAAGFRPDRAQPPDPRAHGAPEGRFRDRGRRRRRDRSRGFPAGARSGPPAGRRGRGLTRRGRRRA